MTRVVGRWGFAGTWGLLAAWTFAVPTVAAPPTKPVSVTATRSASNPPSPPAPILAPPPAPPARRLRIRLMDGRVETGRLIGTVGDESAVLLPEGRIGWTKGTTFTDDPFEPLSPAALRDRLAAGPYKDFQVKQTEHYLIFRKCSPDFANASANLLESLYCGLTKILRDRGLDIHDAEFPLVVVIFATETEYRAFRQVDSEVQAYYDILSNHVVFYETSDRAQRNPEFENLRKPQTVAHEGVHQVLHNIGIQPRLAPWPIWLAEGLAEYCAPTTTKKKAVWAGPDRVNPIHMATIRDLVDPVAQHLPAFGLASGEPGPRAPRGSWTEGLLTKTDLTPTDYAWAWALTHYLANRRSTEFLAYLRDMSRMEPLSTHTPEEHLARFRERFGADLVKLDRAVMRHLNGLKGYEELPYYTVLFEQVTANGRLRRGAFISQSPTYIRQRLDLLQGPVSGPLNWQAVIHPTRSRAILAAEQWANQAP